MQFRTLLACILTAVVTGLLAAQAQVPGVNSTLQTVFTLAYDSSTMKPTYSATQVFTPPTTPTDVCTLTGSATRRVKVRRIIFAGQNSVAVSEWISILKRSTADTGGVGGNLNPTAYDSNFAASTVARAEFWTTSPTGLGTLVGSLADVLIGFANTSTGTLASVSYEFKFGERGSPVVLRGVAQELAVNMASQGGGVGSISCTFEWTEDND